MEIPLPPKNHNKINKLSASEQEKMNKLLASSSLTQGWVKKKSDDRRCNAQEVSLDLQKIYQETVYPVCPVLRKWINTEEGNRLTAFTAADEDLQKKFYNVPIFPIWVSIVRILIVFESLIKLKPDLQTIVKCAHTEDLLKGRLDLIRNDLLALPQSLEKDFPETSKECKELIAELQLAELRYFMDDRSIVYLLPDNLEYGNWATFLQWREQQINRAKLSDVIEMRHLTRHYPAEAIKVMRLLHDKLSPLAKKILPERMLETNRCSAELKEILNEHLNKLTAIKHNGGKNIDSQDKHEDIIELKPNICGIGLNINALIRKKGKNVWSVLKSIRQRLWRS